MIFGPNTKVFFVFGCFFGYWLLHPNKGKGKKQWVLMDKKVE